MDCDSPLGRVRNHIANDLAVRAVAKLVQVDRVSPKPSSLQGMDQEWRPSVHRYMNV